MNGTQHHAQFCVNFSIIAEMYLPGRDNMMTKVKIIARRDESRERRI